MAATKKKKLELIVNPNYQATIIRLSLGLILVFFGVETATGMEFNSLQALSLRSLLNLDIWIYQIIHNFELAKSIVSIFSISIGVLLFLGLLTRTTGIFLSILFLLGIISDPQLFSNPAVALFKKSINFAIIGSSIGLIFDDQGALCLKSFFIAPKIAEIEASEVKKHQISTTVTRIGLACSLLIIFLSIFFWRSENNAIWSHQIVNFSNHFTYFSLPITASIIGSSAILILFGIGTRFIATAIAIFFTIIAAINGLPAYTLLIIIGTSFSLIAGEEYQAITQQTPLKRGKKKFDKQKKIR